MTVMMMIFRKNARLHRAATFGALTKQPTPVFWWQGFHPSPRYSFPFWKDLNHPGKVDLYQTSSIILTLCSFQTGVKNKTSNNSWVCGVKPITVEALEVDDNDSNYGNGHDDYDYECVGARQSLVKFLWIILLYLDSILPFKRFYRLERIVGVILQLQTWR